MWTVRSENRKGHSKKFYQSRTRTSRSSGSRGEPPHEVYRGANAEVVGEWWGSRSWRHGSLGWWCNTPPTTGYQRRDQECSAGHCGVSSRSRAALPKSHEWNTSIGRSGGTYSSSQRTCGIGIHHHMVPCRMCGETPKTGKNQMLGAVWVSSGPKGSRPGSYHRDRAHGHGKEERPTFHAGRSE